MIEHVGGGGEIVARAPFPTVLEIVGHWWWQVEQCGNIVQTQPLGFFLMSLGLLVYNIIIAYPVN